MDTIELKNKIIKNEQDIVTANTQLADIVTIKPSGLIDDTDYDNIQNALNLGKSIKLSSGTYNITNELILPEDKVVSIEGMGFEKTFLKAISVLNSIIKKTGIGFVLGNTLTNLTLDCDLKATHGIEIVSSKQMKINRVRVLDSLGDMIAFGGNPALAFYEAQISELMLEYAPENSASLRPNYGINLLEGANDNYLNDIVIKNVKLAGIKDNHQCNNFYNNIHVYGYPEEFFHSSYAIDTMGSSIITNLYSDSVEIAGVKIRGNNVTIADSIFFWLSNNTTAFAYEIDDGVDYLNIIGDNCTNLNNPLGMFKINGTLGKEVNILNREKKLFSGKVEIKQSEFKNASLSMNGNNGSDLPIIFETDGVRRWQLFKNGVSETGSNSGSNLALNRYDDNGNLIDIIMIVDRATGKSSYYKEMDFQNKVSIKGTWDKPLLINGNYFWTKANGEFWTKSGTVPTSDIDGRLIMRIVSVPSTSTSTGAWGEFAFDGNYMYIATGTNVWKRVGLSTW